MATFPKGCTLLFGGSGGIGSGVSRTFAQAGSDVAIVYRSNAGKAEGVAAEARAMGRHATIHACDVADAQAVTATVEQAIAAHGRVHSVIWAAGPLVNQRYLSSTPMAEWRHL